MTKKISKEITPIWQEKRGHEILFVGMSQFINRGMNQKVTGRIICFMTAIVLVVSVVVL